MTNECLSLFMLSIEDKDKMAPLLLAHSHQGSDMGFTIHAQTSHSRHTALELTWVSPDDHVMSSKIDYRSPRILIYRYSTFEVPGTCIIVDIDSRRLRWEFGGNTAPNIELLLMLLFTSRDRCNWKTIWVMPENPTNRILAVQFDDFPKNGLPVQAVRWLMVNNCC